MTNENKITCPECGYSFDVNSVIAAQLEERYKEEMDKMLNEEKKRVDMKLNDLENQKHELEKQKNEQEELINRKVSEHLKTREAALEIELKSKIESEQSGRIAIIEKELNEKSEKIRELNKTKAENEKLKREKDELKEFLEAENARILNEKISEEREKIKKTEQDRNELIIKELQKKLEDQKKLTEEMTRKQEQGSMQLQGEVQELAIEEWLTSHFPLDTVSEVKKGERGADCLQTVNTNEKSDCGTIYYESKRTKNFSNNWIEKFREDMRLKGADIGVLVTDVYPKSMNRMGLVDGVWVCSYDEFKSLCLVLRESIIRLSSVVSAQENKGEKMTMLYEYLTGNEFKRQLEAIVEGFTQMKADLDSEKRAIASQWKKREKQIEKVLLNTFHMYGSVKGIAGAAIPPINTLELPEAEIDAPENTE